MLVDLAPRAPSTPSPRSASVSTIGGFHVALVVEREDRAHLVEHRLRRRVVRLVDAITSGISMIPAFSAWTESPEPGISTSTTVSAIPITSTSLWPVPTVSRKTTSLPAASSTSSAWSVASARPPRWPRVPIERMKTPGSRKWSVRRMRSPSSAPCVNGLDGSTEITPTVWSCAADVADERADQARLADAGRAGDADRVGAAGVRVELADELVGERVAVLDEGDRARERAPVARRARPRRATPASSPAGSHAASSDGVVHDLAAPERSARAGLRDHAAMTRRDRRGQTPRARAAIPQTAARPDRVGERARDAGIAEPEHARSSSSSAP